MKSKRSLFGILFLLTGLVLVSFPLYMEWDQNKEVKAMEQALSLIAESDGTEPVVLEGIENLSFTKEQLERVMELEIPYIDMKQHVLDETTDTNLNIALTQIKPDQQPGIGNFTIAGHRGYRDGRHFSNLAKVPAGEKVYLHVGDKTYIYEITDTSVIEPTQVDVLDDQAGRNEITMITCTVSGKQRVAVKGQLVEETDRK
ncbi:sortase [Sporosarcina oncorhynchi]|uniref:Sortase n=1 Tax=Sporosarcina oncorhynchi TaxID=3056444 RepID=A0ABZ0L7J0_9BACL|nr:sortase [Sporosarcina sp. T2O-4]WOV88085.1 sortase [Sporosarcina sp. T2O-4]